MGPLVAYGAAKGIDAALNVATSAISSGMSKSNMDYQNKLQMQNWHAQNAYNHPLAQKERLVQAGINPDLMYGGSSGLTPAAPIGTPSTGGASVAPMPTSGVDLASVTQALANARLADSKDVQQNIENTYLSETLSQRVRAVGLANDWTEQDIRKMDQEIANYTNQWSLWQNQIDALRSSKALTDKQVSWYDKHMSAEIDDIKASKAYKQACTRLTDQEREQMDQLFDSMKSLVTNQADLAGRALELSRKYGDAQAIIGMITQGLSAGADLLGVLLKKTPAGLVINNIIPGQK